MTTTSSGAGVWTSVVGAVDISDDVVINHAVTLDGNVDMTVDLTKNASKSLDTTATDYTLEVSGACDVSGTLTCNDSSTVSFGALEILTGATWNATSGTTTIGNDSQSTDAGTRGFFVHNGATFAHNSGTVSFTGTQNISPCYGGTATYNNVTFAQSGSIQYRDTLTGSDNWIIAGTLTINSGATLTNEHQADRLNCTGDCVVAGTLNLNHASGGNHNFGSLTINSGGTYSATSGTTTIKSATGTSSNTLQNSGTLTHNKGLLFFDLSVANGDGYHNILNSSTAGLHTFYDFEIKCDSEYVAMMKSIEVLGNYTVRGSNAIRYESGNATNSLIVHGLATTSSGQLGSADTTGIDTGIPVEKRGWQFLGGLDVTGGTFKLGTNQTVKVS